MGTGKRGVRGNLLLAEQGGEGEQVRSQIQVVLLKSRLVLPQSLPQCLRPCWKRSCIRQSKKQERCLANAPVFLTLP